MLLSNEYRPDVRVEKEASALAKADYDVTVVAWDRRQKLKGEERGDFVLRRIRTSTAATSSRFFLNLPLFYFKLLRTSQKIRPDIVHAHDLDTLVPGVAIARLRGVPLVYDAHEHYAEMVRGDVPGLLSRQLDRLERVLVRRVDLLIAANHKISEYLQTWYPKGIIVVMNCIDVPTAPKITHRVDRSELVIFYGGSLEPLRYIEELIEAVEKDRRLRLVIAGRGRLEDHVRKASERCERIEFMGYLERDMIFQLTLAADAVSVLMDPSNENNQIGTPNRLYEAMALGVPVIASKGTLAGDIVEEENCGIAITWNLKEFEAAVERLQDASKWSELGENGRMAALREYNWSKMKGRLLESYTHLDPNRLDTSTA